MSVARQIESELSTFYPQGELKALVRLLLYEVAGWESTDLLTHPEWTLTPVQQTKIDDAVARLKRYEPIQYIVGHVDFCGATISVDKNVLIPRPETAELIDLVEKNVPKNAHLLDIGTGSGCIAIALAKRLPEAHITAYDISDDALNIARKNAEQNGVQINFEKIDILNAPKISQKFDAIVSNPPYVMQREKSQMQPNVLDYEPALALFVADDEPLIFYDRIADFAKTNLTDGGKLFFEINHLLAHETAELMLKKGLSSAELVKDCFEKERFLIVRSEN